MATTYRVSCHCAQIRLEVTADLGEVVECNAIVRSARAPDSSTWYVAPEPVRLLTERQRLSTYAWRCITGGQHFCPTCGIAVIQTATQYPPPVSINARCLEDVDIAGLKIRQFDGKHAIP